MKVKSTRLVNTISSKSKAQELISTGFNNAAFGCINNQFKALAVLTAKDGAMQILQEQYICNQVRLSLLMSSEKPRHL
jgi:hypothetical protein